MRPGPGPPPSADRWTEVRRKSPLSLPAAFNPFIARPTPGSSQRSSCQTAGKTMETLLAWAPSPWDRTWGWGVNRRLRGLGRAGCPLQLAAHLASPCQGVGCVWEGRPACPRPLGETDPTPRPANLSCQLLHQWEGEVVRFATAPPPHPHPHPTPHRPVGGATGTQPSKEWVLFLAEIRPAGTRPAGTHCILGLCWG